MKKIRFCGVCGIYTLEEKHCGNPSRSAHPSIYNPRDPYGSYRRMKKGI